MEFKRCFYWGCLAFLAMGCGDSGVVETDMDASLQADSFFADVRLDTSHLPDSAFADSGTDTSPARDSAARDSAAGDTMLLPDAGALDGWGDDRPLPLLADRDLDGIPDDADGFPDDPYGERDWTTSGSGAHEEVPAPETVTTSWDGVISIGVAAIGSGSTRQYEYTARAFRPRSVVAGSALSTANFSPTVNFDPPDLSLGNLHLGLFRDSVHLPGNAAGQNPYPSDALGNPAGDGSFRTYKIGIIGVILSEANAPHAQRLALNYGTIIVANALGEEPFIQAASVDGMAAPLTSISGDGLYRYEPTVSLDGRLVVWHGIPQNRFNGFATMYSFNPNPMTSTGWSEARNVAAMYWTHGPGARAETMVDGVRFSERYPIAQNAFRDPSGRVLQSGDLIPGPYPWLSPDATELFFTSVATFRGAIRSGTVAVGVRTNWVIQHLDSAINTSRSTLSSDDEIHFAIERDVEGTRLMGSYSLHTLSDGTPLGRTGFERILMSGILLSGSMWDPFLGQDNPPLPRQASSETYAFLTLTRRYGEVSLAEVPDGHYLLSLPMNEQLTFDADALNQLNGDTPRSEFWGLTRRAVTHHPRRTPDTSGNLQVGLLFHEAAFPFEYHDAQGRWNQYLAARIANPALPDTAQGVSGDTIDGIIGNAIYLSAGGSVRTRMVPSTLARLRATDAFTIQFWLKPLRAGDYSLAAHAGFAFLRINPAGQVTVHPGVSAAAELTSATTLPMNRWSHVALVVRGGNATLLVDGDESDSGPTAIDPARAVNEVMIVGPYDLPTGSGPALCLVDQFSLSDVDRTQGEVRVAALRQPIRRNANVGALGVPAAFASQEAWVPDGVQDTAARIALGARLFEDAQLSRDESTSCASCHDADLAFTDNRTLSIGIAGRMTSRNSQTIQGRLHGREQFWDGRAASVELQALQPIADVNEMDFSADGALVRLWDDASYGPGFAAAFPGEPAPTRFQLATSLAAFIRSRHPGVETPFDAGEMSLSARRGQGLFFGEARCSSCHNGPRFTDERFHNPGLRASLPENAGRGDITLRSGDLGRFKTPTLRELTSTAPYFHDGRFATLEDVVRFYSSGGETGATNRDPAIQELGLSVAQQADLVAFLRALSSR